MRGINLQNFGIAVTQYYLHSLKSCTLYSVICTLRKVVLCNLLSVLYSTMLDNQNELLPLVDEEGNIIGSATRRECHDGSHLLHPVVHLHVFNTKGELYLQHRPEWKDIQPDKWDTAVGGHVDLGECVGDALRREVREEIGLTDFTPEHICTYVFESARDRELVYVFKTTTDETPTPSAELAGGAFFSAEEIKQRIGTGFFTPNFESEYQRCFGE